MKDFIAKIPLLLISFSNALLYAFKKQILEIGEICQSIISGLIQISRRTAKMLWSLYCRIEYVFLRLIIDAWFLIVSLRPLIAFVAIGFALIWYKQFIVFAIYLLFLLLLIMRHCTLKKDIYVPDNDKLYSEYARMLKLPLRIFVTLVISYSSWNYVDWKSLNIQWPATDLVPPFTIRGAFNRNSYEPNEPNTLHEPPDVKKHNTEGNNRADEPVNREEEIRRAQFTTRNAVERMLQERDSKDKAMRQRVQERAKQMQLNQTQTIIDKNDKPNN